ncbi:hypothetical protein BDN72DRAFT_377980 [Pluteus cervinus]|uniref:Uncharacterized protein n=1 Tax=Pluteus cervinus TaxID=181527 RepID=A0ACD3AAP5_9AGAR|nr:hypothetical protein BDN72DRAFT_377980 [Pluteus cervinus]
MIEWRRRTCRSMGWVNNVINLSFLVLLMRSFVVHYCLYRNRWAYIYMDLGGPCAELGGLSGLVAIRLAEFELWNTFPPLYAYAYICVHTFGCCGCVHAYNNIQLVLQSVVR